MIRENVLPVLAEKNLCAAAVMRSVSIVIEVSVTDERTKILADRLSVVADSLAARVAEISGAFTANGDGRVLTERTAHKTETRALKRVDVPPHREFCSAVAKSCHRSFPEPGSRGDAFIGSLEAAENNARFCAEESEFILSLIGAPERYSCIAPDALRSLSEFFSYSAEFFRSLQTPEKVDYSVTELSSILSAIIEENSAKRGKSDNARIALKLAAESALSEAAAAANAVFE